MSSIVSQVQNAFTSVHAQETETVQNSTESFRDLCLRGMEDEYSSTWQAYAHDDDENSKFRADKLDECRTHAWYSVNTSTRLVRVASNSCRLRWCPICSRALSHFRKKSLSDWIGENGPCRFLTLTLKHTDDSLTFQIDHIYKCFSRLRSTAFFKRYVTGGVWFFQVLRSKTSGQWHPHIHIVLSGDFVPRKGLVAQWERITCGSTIVDIRPIRDKDKIAEYVARYSSRPAMLSQFSEDDVHEIFHSLEGRRLCGRFGLGRSCSLVRDVKIAYDEWRRIGNWTTVNGSKGDNRLARSIWWCWKNNQPLPAEVSLEVWDKPGYSLCSGDVPDIVFIDSFGDPDT